MRRHVESVRTAVTEEHSGSRLRSPGHRRRHHRGRHPARRRHAGPPRGPRRPGRLRPGTSSRSSRLIHGGLRYLEHGQMRLVFEALRERSVLRRIAPHLVRPLPFVFPVHNGDRRPRWKLAAGMWLYDLLSLFRNVRPHMLGKAACWRGNPVSGSTGLRGGGRYYDAQCDDARLVVATPRSAHAHGATILTYTTVTGLTLDGGRVTGATVRDVRTGREATFRANVVVNATGPWADQLRRMEDPEGTSPAPPHRRHPRRSSAAPGWATTGHHLHQPARRAGHVHPALGRPLLYRYHGHRLFGRSADEVRASPRTSATCSGPRTAAFPMRTWAKRMSWLPGPECARCSRTERSSHVRVPRAPDL